MLLKITEHCSMGCSHCLSDCKPDNSHMTDETFEQAIKFLRAHRNGLTTIVLSGGEPTEHPKFKQYLKDLVGFFNNGFAICVTTNGKWIVENTDEFRKLVEDLKKVNMSSQVFWQVTSDSRYYPELVDISRQDVKSLADVCIIKFDTVPQIYPQGRALDNNLDYTVKGPKCFNIRSISNNVDNFLQVLSFLEISGYRCIPSIDYNGDLKLGESKLCPMCSTIWDSDEQIMGNIRGFRCMKCKEAIANLSERELSVLK